MPSAYGLPAMMGYLVYLLLVAVGAALVWQARRLPPGRLLPFVFVLFAGVAAAVISLYSTGRGTPFRDFDKAYYRAGQFATVEPARLYECDAGEALCFVNLPIVALAFAPLAALSLSTAHTVVAVASVGAVFAVGWLLLVLTKVAGWRRYAVLALVVLNGPLYYSLRLANLTHVVLALLALALWWLLTSQQAKAGVALAVCAIIKPPLLIWLPYFMLRRQWRAVAGMGAGLLLVVVASVSWFGVDLHRLWLEQFITGKTSHSVGAYNVQSIAGFLVRLTTSGALLNWQPVDVGSGFRVVQAALSLAVVAVALLAGVVAGAPRTTSARLREYSVLLCVMLAVSPISWTHYYCFLLIPLAAYVAGRLEVPPGGAWRLFVALAGLLVSLPVMLWVPPHRLWGALIERILLSHYFFGGLLLLAVLVAAAVRGSSVREALASPAVTGPAASA